MKLKLKIVLNVNSTVMKFNELHLLSYVRFSERLQDIYNMSNQKINEARMLKIFFGNTFIEQIKP